MRTAFISWTRSSITAAHNHIPSHNLTTESFLTVRTESVCAQSASWPHSHRRFHFYSSFLAFTGLTQYKIERSAKYVNGGRLP